MFYTNDEADKTTRQKNFYLGVYVLPAAIVLILCGLLYWAYVSDRITGADLIYGCVLSLTPATFLSAFNTRNWLKMPDGTYHNIKGISPANHYNTDEPNVYESEYYFSKAEKAKSVFFGLVLLGMGVWFAMDGVKSYLIPIGAFLGGVYLCYIGIKGYFDKTPKLKIASNGLWTARLGFVHWDHINYAEVVEDKSGKEPQLYLEIRLKGTVFEEVDEPDERLLLTDLQDKTSIEMVINDSIIRYNEGKNKASADRDLA